MNLETIAAERKIAGDELAGIVGGEEPMELDGVAGKFDGGLDRKAVGPGDLEAKFSGVALRQEWESEEENAEVEQWAHGVGGGVFMLPVSQRVIELPRERRWPSNCFYKLLTRV